MPRRGVDRFTVVVLLGGVEGEALLAYAAEPFSYFTTPIQGDGACRDRGGRKRSFTIRLTLVEPGFEGTEVCQNLEAANTMIAC